MLPHVHAANIYNITKIIHTHPYLPAPFTTSKNLNSYLAAEYNRKPHHFQEAINQLTINYDTASASTAGGPCTIISSSDIIFK